MLFLLFRCLTKNRAEAGAHDRSTLLTLPRAHKKNIFFLKMCCFLVATCLFNMYNIHINSEKSTKEEANT
jgi:hypothetical protein